MARKEIGNPLDRENRNNHNDNYKELFKEIGVVDKRIDGMIDEISDQAFDKVIDNSKLNWKEPVNNFNSLPSSAQKGDTRMDRSTGKVYRYDGSEWKEIQQIDAGPVNELDSRLTSQLNETESQLAQSANNFKPSWSVWEEFDQRKINIRWFGAVPDADYYDDTTQLYYSDAAMTIPATDNAPILQSAVDFLASIGGGELYAPKGNYVFRSGVKWKSKVSLIGNGVGNTKFFGEGDKHSLFYNHDFASTGLDSDNPDAWLEDCRFEDFECDQKGLTHPYASVSGKAFFILYMRRARFHNLLLKNTVGTALGCDFLTDSVISNVVVINAGRNWGIYDPDRGFTSGIGQSGIGVGTAALEEETLVITDCHVYNCGNYGIFVEIQDTSDTAFRSKYAKIVNCHTEGNRIGIGNKGSGATIINSCSIYKNVDYGIDLVQGSFGDMVLNSDIDSNGVGVYLGGDYVGHCMISNNHIHNSVTHGITKGNKAGLIMEHVSIKNNVIEHNGASGILFNTPHKNFEIKNNEIFNNNQSQGTSYADKGIYLQDSDGIRVIGNTLYDNQVVKTQTYSITLMSRVDNYFLQGNSFGNGLVSITSQDGIINDNDTTVVRGKATIIDGETGVYVNHYLGDLTSLPAQHVILTPAGDGRVWVSASHELNRIRIGREGTVGTLEVFYEIRV